MSRLFLAFLCFLRILFGKKLPPEAMKFLPETTTPAPELPPAEKPADKALPPPAATRPAPEVKPEPACPAPAPEERPRVSAAQQHRHPQPHREAVSRRQRRAAWATRARGLNADRVAPHRRSSMG